MEKIELLSHKKIELEAESKIINFIKFYFKSHYTFEKNEQTDCDRYIVIENLNDNDTIRSCT